MVDVSISVMIQSTVLSRHADYPLMLKVYKALKAVDAEVYLAGGCVRDFLLNRDPHDLDLASSLTPDQVIQALSGQGFHFIEVGKAFGVLVIIHDQLPSRTVEVTTFRKDLDYFDRRRPLRVEFRSAIEDAERRDFTMNGLFYDIEKDQVIDYVEGVKHIQEKLICAIGDPNKRFDEDSLRVWRGYRFASQLGFAFESSTLQAMQKGAEMAWVASRERILKELDLFFAGKFLIQALPYFLQSGLFKVISSLRVSDMFAFADSEPFLKPWARNIFLYLHLDIDDLRTWPLSKSDKEFIKLFDQYYLGSEAFSDEGQMIEKFLSCKAWQAFYLLSSLLAPTWLTGEVAAKLRALEAKASAWGALPKAFLDAQDVLRERVDLKGAEIGRALKIAFYLQLEMKLENRSDSLVWLKEFKA